MLIGAEFISANQSMSILKSELKPLRQIPTGLNAPKYVTYSDEINSIVLSQEWGETQFFSGTVPDSRILHINTNRSGSVSMHAIADDHIFRVINTDFGSLRQKSCIEKYNLNGDLKEVVQYNFSITCMFVHHHIMYIGTYFGAVRTIDLTTLDTLVVLYDPESTSGDPMGDPVTTMYLTRDLEEVIVSTFGQTYFKPYGRLWAVKYSDLSSVSSIAIPKRCHSIVETGKNEYWMGCESGAILHIVNLQILGTYSLQYGRINNMHYFDQYLYTISYDRSIAVFDVVSKVKILEYDMNWTMQSTCRHGNNLILTNECRGESELIVCVFPHAAMHNIQKIVDLLIDVFFDYV
jgi:hypothetical protein